MLAERERREERERERERKRERKRERERGRGGRILYPCSVLPLLVTPCLVK